MLLLVSTTGLVKKQGSCPNFLSRRTLRPSKPNEEVDLEKSEETQELAE